MGDQVCGLSYIRLQCLTLRVEQEQRKSQVRLMTIVGLAAVVLIAGLAVSIIGSRQVNDKAEDLRQTASDATVDPGLMSLTDTGVDSAATRRARSFLRVGDEFSLTRGTLLERTCWGHGRRGAFDADLGAE